MDIIKIFADNVRKYRCEQHLSQEKLADMSNLHRTYISSLECYNRSISLTNIQKLADALQIETYKLFIENNNDDAQYTVIIREENIMPTANKEFILNYAMNRWQLNFKRNVGPTSDSIRECNPDSLSQWVKFYYENIRTEQHLEELGRQLYDHVKNDLPEEKRFHPELLNSIQLNDCIDYMKNVVLERTYNGYMKERGKE